MQYLAYIPPYYIHLNKNLLRLAQRKKLFLNVTIIFIKECYTSIVCPVRCLRSKTNKYYLRAVGRLILQNLLLLMNKELKYLPS